MSENITSINSSEEQKISTTQGMTTKVVKGSIWTLAGQVLPLLASFVATPFVIRLLGSESYGVLILIGLIPSYFGFADFGMGIASTKFGSEAYGQGLRNKEGKVVRTAALVALASSFPFVFILFVFSPFIINWLNVPENLQPEANLALKIAAATFEVNILNSIFNTPQLARLRMDLNTLVTAGPRLFGIIAMPFVIYWGGGIIGAVSVLFFSSILTLAGHLYVSSRLLKELWQYSIDKDKLIPLLKFGGPLVISGIAGILLVNLEKVVLARTTSVESLAYYSVAYTFASMATMLSGSMIQSLLPAFSQLLVPGKETELNKLFSRTLRINIIFLVPTIIFLFIVAKPFFTVWAGENFGRESTVPFYVLLLGLFFNIIAYIPHTSLVASGRTDVLAKIYWLELFPYILITAIFTNQFGAIGAAMAWSLRVTVDALVFILFSKKIVQISLRIFNGKGYLFGLTLLLLVLPLVIVEFISQYRYWLIIIFPAGIFVYFYIVWKNFLETEEKHWIKGKLYAVFNR